MDWENEKNDLEERQEEITESDSAEETEDPIEDPYYSSVKETSEVKEPTKEKKMGNTKGLLLGVLLGSVVTLIGGFVFLPYFVERALPEDLRIEQQLTIEGSRELGIYSAVAEKAMPSVVGITTITLERDAWLGEIRERPGLGTGVIVDGNGYILTNSHVVGDGEVSELMVLLHDGREMPGEVLWNEASLDLAIIKVDTGGEVLPVAHLGDSDKLIVGEITIAIGNPMGLDFERTLTQGVVSGLNRSIATGGIAEGIDNFIQTDASINPGNSGGPLLNTNAEVIGINTAKLQNGEGLGFAIPINTAKPIIEQFAETGEFTPVFLGVQGLNAEMYQRSWGVDLGVEYGFYVAEVNPGSVADRYGIESDDVIIGINGIQVSNRGILIRELYTLRPGDRATITIVRDSEEMDIEVLFD